jgi:hypothetical protein
VVRAARPEGVNMAIPFLDVNKDGKIDGKDFVAVGSNVIFGVLDGVIDDASEELAANTILEGEDKWRQSCLNRVNPKFECSAGAPADVLALSDASRAWFVTMVADKYVNEIENLGAGVLKKGLAWIKAKLVGSS